MAPARMETHLIGAIHLEGVRASIHKLFQVLEPRHTRPGKPVQVLRVEMRILDEVVRQRLVVRAFGRFARGCAQEMFLIFADIVVAAQPQAHLEAHGMQGMCEAALGLVRQPEWLVKQGFVPFLVNREIVVRLHPARLQPNQVAGNALASDLLTEYGPAPLFIRSRSLPLPRCRASRSDVSTGLCRPCHSAWWRFPKMTKAIRALFERTASGA